MGVGRTWLTHLTRSFCFEEAGLTFCTEKKKDICKCDLRQTLHVTRKQSNLLEDCASAVNFLPLVCKSKLQCNVSLDTGQRSQRYEKENGGLCSVDSSPYNSPSLQHSYGRILLFASSNKANCGLSKQTQPVVPHSTAGRRVQWEAKSSSHT